MTTIIIKNSSTASSAPVAGDLTKGELAVNVTDKKLYTKDNGGSVVKLVGSLGNQEANAVAVTGGAIDGTPIGATTASTASFTTLSASGNVTLSGGTANGVAYLNGSKVVTTGSALTFDGTNLGVGTSATALSTYRGAEFAGTTVTTGGFLRMRTSDSSINSLDFLDVNGRAIFTTTNHPLRFGVNDTEQMRLTSTGLGIGTSSPSYKLHVAGSSARVLVASGDTSYAVLNATNNSGQFVFAIDNSTGSGYGMGNYSRVLYADGSYPICFATNGSERMRLDSSGNLGLGVTPSAWDSIIKPLEFFGSAYIGGQTSGVPTLYAGANAYYSGGAWKYKTTNPATNYYSTNGQHQWFTAPSGTAGNAISFTQAMTLDASGNLVIGATSSNYGKFTVANGTNQFTTGFTSNIPIISSVNAAASAYVDLIIDSSVLRFQQSGTERARIDSSGNLLVGTTSATPYPTQGLSIYGDNGGSALIGMGHVSGTASGNAYMTFAYNGSGIGSITQSGTTAVLYNVTSDQRLKENIVDAPEFGSVIDSIKVRSYDWKSDGNHQRAGFVAQELITMVPEAVHQPADPEEMMAVDYSKLVPMLVKEIQSLRQRLAQAGI